MKLVTLTVFGAGYVLGTKAGRQRYEQIVALAKRASEGLEGSATQERLESYAARLEAYARDSGLGVANGTRAPRRS